MTEDAKVRSLSKKNMYWRREGTETQENSREQEIWEQYIIGCCDKD